MKTILFYTELFCLLKKIETEWRPSALYQTIWKQAQPDTETMYLQTENIINAGPKVFFLGV